MTTARVEATQIVCIQMEMSSPLRVTAMARGRRLDLAASDPGVCSCWHPVHLSLPTARLVMTSGQETELPISRRYINTNIAHRPGKKVTTSRSNPRTSSRALVSSGQYIPAKGISDLEETLSTQVYEVRLPFDVS